MPERPDGPVVSGEILTRAGQIRDSSTELSPDIVEAEYETIVARYARPDQRPVFSSTRSSGAFGLDILRRDTETRDGGRAGGAFWLVGLAIVAGVFWISGGHSLVTAGPRSAFPAASASKPGLPLEIREVKSGYERSGNRDILLVKGKVVNTGRTTQPLPDLVIRVTAVDRTSTRYRIVANDGELVAGGGFIFTSRLDVPETGMENIEVTIRDRNSP